jgi:hypothetical protein
MSEPTSVSKRVDEAIERAIAMERGGNLEALLEQEAAKVKKALYEEVLRRRQEAASAEAAFPPSAVSALPKANDARGGDEGAVGPDPGRCDPLRADGV